MKQRQSNFELLRIIAMFMVVAIHIVIKMMFTAFPETITWKYCAIIYSVSHTAVPIFIMLTGFFSYKSEHKVLRRIKTLSLPYLFYVLVFTVFHLVFNPSNQSIPIILGLQIKALTTTISYYFLGQMWYLYILIVLIVLSPYINMLIEKMEKKVHRNLIIILVVIFLGLPTLNTLFDMKLLYVFSSDTTRNLLPLFITYYLLGAYYAKYDITIKKRYTFSVFAISTITIFLLSYFWSVYHPGAHFIQFFTGEGIINNAYIDKLHAGTGFNMQLMYYNSVFILISSSALLLFFKELKIKSSRIINFIASLTFGVYINHLFVRYLLYKVLPSSKEAAGFDYMKITAAAICLTFLLSLAIEGTRVLFTKGSIKILKIIRKIFKNNY